MTLKKRSKNQVTSGERRNLLKAWSRSGLNADAFALKHGVGVSTLYKWRQRYQADDGDRPTSPKFLPVKVTQGQTQAAEIHAPNSVVIRVYADTDEGSLIRALKAVLQCG
ncbi:MAG: hypothetical protein KA712_00580 [Myxococcales bacterium]|jgi:transposase-like protein|nr:hypothetical protein [Myxococcales bacterium]